MTAGATEALAATILALIDDGDEVVTLEPFYDSYAAMIALGRGVHRTVPLRAPDFQPDLDELRSGHHRPHADHPRQQPAQPDGRRARAGDPRTDRRARPPARRDHRHRRGLRAPASSARSTFPIASLPGAARAHGHDLQRRQDLQHHGLEDRLADGAARARRVDPRGQAVPHLCQRRAVPAGDRGGARPAGRLLRAQPRPCSQASATCSRPGSKAAGFTVSDPRGSYFIVADAAPLGFPDAAAFCRRLPELAGVVAVPITAFVSPENAHEYASLVRFAFCKKTELLERASEALARI